MASDAGDTQSLPPRPGEVLAAELAELAAAASRARNAVEGVEARSLAATAALERSQAAVASLESDVKPAADVIQTASASISAACESLDASIGRVEEAALIAQGMVDRLVRDGVVEPVTARELAIRQGPAWVLGVAVLALAFYLVYARITSAGPWVAVAVGLVMAVALTLRAETLFPRRPG